MIERDRYNDETDNYEINTMMLRETEIQSGTKWEQEEDKVTDRVRQDRLWVAKYRFVLFNRTFDLRLKRMFLWACVFSHRNISSWAISLPECNLSALNYPHQVPVIHTSLRTNIKLLHTSKERQKHNQNATRPEHPKSHKSLGAWRWVTFKHFQRSDPGLT